MGTLQELFSHGSVGRSTVLRAGGRYVATPRSALVLLDDHLVAHLHRRLASRLLRRVGLWGEQDSHVRKRMVRRRDSLLRGGSGRERRGRRDRRGKFFEDVLSVLVRSRLRKLRAGDDVSRRVRSVERVASSSSSPSSAPSRNSKSASALDAVDPLESSSPAVASPSADAPVRALSSSARASPDALLRTSVRTRVELSFSPLRVRRARVVGVPEVPDE